MLDRALVAPAVLREVTLGSLTTQSWTEGRKTVMSFVDLSRSRRRFDDAVKGLHAALDHDLLPMSISVQLELLDFAASQNALRPTDLLYINSLTRSDRRRLGRNPHVPFAAGYEGVASGFEAVGDAAFAEGKPVLAQHFYYLALTIQRSAPDRCDSRLPIEGKIVLAELTALRAGSTEQELWTAMGTCPVGRQHLITLMRNLHKADLDRYTPSERASLYLSLGRSLVVIGRNAAASGCFLFGSIWLVQSHTEDPGARTSMRRMMLADLLVELARALVRLGRTDDAVRFASRAEAVIRELEYGVPADIAALSTNDPNPLPFPTEEEVKRGFAVSDGRGSR